METTLIFDSKMGFGKSEDFVTSFIPPLELNPKSDYKVSLISATMWHSWRNITSANNKFDYFNGTKWTTLVIPEGAYNITDIDAAVKRMVEENGDYDDKEKKYYIHIEANYNTLHSRLVLKNGYKVDFTVPNTFRRVLGFDSKKIQGDGTYESNHVVNITDIESLQIHCSLITNSYVNGNTSSVLYALSPNVPPGYLIQVNPQQNLPVDISKRGLVNSVRFRVTNQSGKLVDMNNERVTYFFPFERKPLVNNKQCLESVITSEK